MIAFGRYNLLVKIGEGGMGSVWLARQKVLCRFCALKLIDPHLAQKPGVAERFLREGRTAAALTHPNLVGVFDGDVFDGHHFIAMEYVEGFALAEIFAAHGALPLPLALLWLNQAAQALDYIHHGQLIHRDVKPHNMLIGRDGTLKLMDLGLAKQNVETDNTLTIAGAMMGSPSYMSPEQIQDSKTVDARTDLYSLGISFYQMITGKLPFEHTSAAAVCVAHLQEPMPSVNLPDADLTAALDQFIAALTAKKRDDRPPSAAAVVAGLVPWLGRYPWDPAAAVYFSKIQFRDRTVSRLLEQEKINPADVDGDPAEIHNRDLVLPPPVAGAVATILQTKTSMARAATTDVMPAGAPHAPPPPRRLPWLWLISGVLLGAVLVGATAAVTLKVAVPKILAAAKARTKSAASASANPTPDLQARQQQRRAFAERSLDEAHQQSPADWPKHKETILNHLRNAQEHFGRQRDQVQFERALATFSELLEEVRALDEAAYRRDKPKLVERWLAIGRKNPDKSNRPLVEQPPAAPPPLAEP